MRLLFPTISIIAMTVSACLAVLAYRFALLPGWREQRWFGLIAASASLEPWAVTCASPDLRPAGRPWSC